MKVWVGLSLFMLVLSMSCNALKERFMNRSGKTDEGSEQKNGQAQVADPADLAKGQKEGQGEKPSDAAGGDTMGVVKENGSANQE